MESKVILITGASSGIGAGTAIYMSKHGYRKFALVARREDKLKEVSTDCKKAGATDVLILKKDLMVEKDRERVIEETISHFGSKQQTF